jgi:hypothetical protein
VFRRQPAGCGNAVSSKPLLQRDDCFGHQLIRVDATNAQRACDYWGSNFSGEDGTAEYYRQVSLLRKAQNSRGPGSISRKSAGLNVSEFRDPHSQADQK